MVKNFMTHTFHLIKTWYLRKITIQYQHERRQQDFNVHLLALLLDPYNS